MNQKYFSIKTITDFLVNLEAKYRLLEWKVGGIFVWQSARVNIYLSIQDKLFPQRFSQQPSKIPSKLKPFIQSRLINCLAYNPFCDFRRNDCLVFESGRKYLYKNSYIDIYTKYLCDYLENKGASYKRYETNYLYDHFALNRHDVKHLDFISICSKLVSKLILVNISRPDVDKIRNIEHQISNALNIHIDLLNIFSLEIKSFKSQYLLYYALFKLKKAKKVYLVNSCDKAPLVKAAKDNETMVIEMQHGIMVKEDLIDHFPNTLEDSVEYFPHKFCIWKDFSNTSKLPLSKANIISVDNMHLRYMKEGTRNIRKSAKMILIASQPRFSEKILEFVLRTASQMKQFRFIYKLHPTEEPFFYNQLVRDKLVMHKNIDIADNKSSIYVLLAKSKYVIGIYSTVLFEAPFFDCNVLLLNLPGVEMASALVEHNKARIVEPHHNLSDYL